MSASPSMSYFIFLPVTPGRKTDLQYIEDNSNHPRLTLLETFPVFSRNKR